ncbi:hypothetical protein KEJ50_06920 [Candidatus Bathyarchaeota archaeon]|nr:hypothetical protein [Candidatus Bathyarchaeota archaeon]
MLKTATKFFIIFLFFWLLCWIQPVKALTEIKAEENYVEFQSLIALNQNVTLLKKFEYFFNEDTLQMLNDALTQAIKNQTSSASIHNLKASIKINENWVNISLFFKVEGVLKKLENKIIVDCSWKNFQVKNSLIINEVEVNKFGEAYLTPLIKKYENSSEARFWINKTHSTSPEEALEIANKFLMLDFKEFSKPLEEWNKTYNVKMQTTTLQYNAPSKINFNLTIIEGNQSKSYIVKLDSKAVIYASGYAKASENMLIFNVKEGVNEKNVTSLILTLILTVAIIHFYERKQVKN